MKISATGNEFKPSTLHDSFLIFTGHPDGGNYAAPDDPNNTEIHLTFDGCCGAHGQGWFRISDLEAGIAAARAAAIPTKPINPDTESADQRAERVMAWAEYRNTYGVNERDLIAAHKAFMAGWEARADATTTEPGPLR